VTGLGDHRVPERVAGIEANGELGAELSRHLGAQQLALPVGGQSEGEQLERGQHVGGPPGLEVEPQDLELGGQGAQGPDGRVDPRAQRVELRP
jgi:hypothetical protein